MVLPVMLNNERKSRVNQNPDYQVLIWEQSFVSLFPSNRLLTFFAYLTCFKTVNQTLPAAILLFEMV